MTKEDYMRLPKERLAELLAERDARDTIIKSIPQPSIQIPTYVPDCFHDGPCTNPFHDCINCPRMFGWERGFTSDTNTTSTDEIK